MSILKKIKDKTGTIHDLGDSRVNAFETELSGAEHNVPYSPAVLAKTNAIETSISNHVGNTANPHKVTKAQIGLANVENKSSTQIRSELTKENVTNALGYTPIDESRIGAANGVASLDASGRIPASQIPGGFDNIEEYDNLAAFPTTGEEGKIYVAKDTNLTYRWTGSQYVEISPSLALGETATTAYRGDRGKVAYTHSQVSGNSTIHHTHANKELLDTYTQTDADLANAVAKVHEHGNKSVLDGITSDKVNSWDGKQNALKAGSGITISNSTISALNRLFPVDISTNKTKDFDNLPSDNILYYKNSYIDFSNQPERIALRFIQWTSSNYYSLQLAISYNRKIYIRTSNANSNNDGKVWGNWTRFANIDELDKVNSSLTNHKNNTTVHITADERTAWNAKQSALTFDTTPTAGSTNPVTSGGIKTALDLKANASDLSKHTGDTTVHITAAERTAWNAKQAALTFDTTPKASSTNPVTSGGIKTALDLKANASDLSKHTGDTTVHITAAERTAWNAKQAALTFDTTPKASSTNPVTSGGIKTAIDTVGAKGIVINEIDGENVICFE